MSAFARELHQLADRLHLPPSVRSRILLELAADLHDLETSLRRAGASVEDAHRRAVETLVPTADVLADLEGLHRPLYQRLVDRFSDPARHRLERAIMLLVGGGLVALGGVWLGREGIFTDSSAFLWPLLALGFATAVMGAWKSFELFVKKDRGSRLLRHGMWVLPVVAVAAVVIGLGGVALELYSLADQLATDRSREGVELLRWLRRDTAMLSIGLLVSSIAGVLWLMISAGLARMEQSEAELLAGIGDVPKGGAQ